jgi:hypothetical protein
MVRSKCQAGESEKLVLPWTTFVVSSWWNGETSIAMDIFCSVASHEGQPNTIERLTILFRQCGEPRDSIRLSQLDCVLHCVSDLILLI